MSDKLLSEINNIKRIMGLSLLNEGGKSDIVRKGIDIIDNTFKISTKSVDNLALEVGEDAAKLLKKLADPNDATPLTKIMNDLYVANKTVARNVYSQLRKAFDSFPDSQGMTLNSKIDDISTKAEEMFNKGSIDEAAEYFNTEIERLLKDSTTDDDLINTVIKFERDSNRRWYLSSSTSSSTGGATQSSTGGAKQSSTGGVGDVSAQTNINKTLGELVNELSDEDTDKLFDYVMQKPWKLNFQNLMKRIRTLVQGGGELQDETLNLIAALRKTNDSAKETALIEQIVKNVQDLKALEDRMYKQLNNWIESKLKTSPDRDIRQLYNKLSKEEGWSKIKELDGLWKRMWGGAKTGFIDYGSHSRDLRNAWLKLMTRPITLPVEIFRLYKEGRNFEWLTKLTDTEKDAVKKWFRSGSPSGWEKLREIGKKMGFPGQVTYVTSQLFRRWVSFKLIAGFFQTLIGAGIHYAGYNEKLQEYPILEDYFGLNPYEQNSGSVAFLKNILDNARASELGWIIPIIGIAIDAVRGAGHLMRGSFKDDLEVVQTEIDRVEAEAENQGIITTTETATVEGAKEVADEQIKDSIWGDENGNIFLAAEGGARYRITFENNVYMVEFPNNKKKLSEL